MRFVDLKREGYLFGKIPINLYKEIENLSYLEDYYQNFKDMNKNETNTSLRLVTKYGPIGP